MSVLDNNPGADGHGLVADAANDPQKTAGAKLAQEAGAEMGRGHNAHAGAEDFDLVIPPSQTVPIDTSNKNWTVGIDVSEFQKTIDWPQVQQAGVQFAFIRATEGTTIQDTDFVQNWQGAEKAGIKVGAYHYLTTASPINTQIDNFVNETKLVDRGDLPPVLDVEDPAQFAKYTIPQRVAMIQQWLDGVQQQTGVQPLLYMSSNFSAKVLGNTTQFDKYKLWVADYRPTPLPVVPQPWTDWQFWQHTDSGQVPGISVNVDLDYFNGQSKALPVLPPEATKPEH